ncbi:MAG: zf-HC2 domain-containing protein [Gemmatimonadaceae bacterium]|nr:zf-HC2 domain-containing protein [Gemmatimonadaceae bacterium]
MTESLHAMRPSGQPEDDAAREARHQVLATLLGAYADGELPVETCSQIDAHLLGCGRCRSELRVQQAVSLRLSRSTVPTATAALQARIRSALATTPTPVASAPPVSTVRRPVRRWAAVGLLLTTITAFAAVMLLPGGSPQLDPQPMVAGPAVPAIAGILAESRRVLQGDLPGRARDLEAVRRALPFPVNPIANPEAHLLAAWTAALDGEPAAVLAYRWNEQVVLQFVVAESSLFRTPELRRAFAERRAVVSQDGAQGLIAWPEASAGSVLVGDMPWVTLVPLSRAHVR